MKKRGINVIPIKDINNNTDIGTIRRNDIMPTPNVFQGLLSATNEMPPMVFGNNRTISRITSKNDKQRMGSIYLKMRGCLG
jgi:hypothetical protein